jgi:hypothetical protein
MVGLYLQFPVRLHGIVLNYAQGQITLFFTAQYNTLGNY